MISRHEIASYLLFLQIFSACGTIILCLAASSPRPRGTNPVRKKSMLAYFMTSPGSNHAITLPIEQPAQQRSQQQVLVRAQQLAAAASSNYQPALLPQHKAPRSATASRQRRCSVEVDARISGSELRSSASYNQLASDRRSPPAVLAAARQALAAYKCATWLSFGVFFPILLHYRLV